MTNGILLTRHNQEIAQWSPDPFPREIERVGSGHETKEVVASYSGLYEECEVEHMPGVSLLGTS